MKIYQIRNKLNGMSYVGRTVQPLAKRFGYHIAQPHCRKLYEAIKQFGKDCFSIEVIEGIQSANSRFAQEREAYWIKELNTVYPNGYNLQAGDIHRHHHLETRKKMSISRVGIKMTGKAAAGVARGPRQAIVGQNISKAKSGKPNGLLGKKRPGIEHLKARVPVIAILNNGEHIRFDSIDLASKHFKCQRSNIHKVLSGHRKKAGGASWHREAVYP